MNVFPGFSRVQDPRGIITSDDSEALMKVRCWLPDAGMSQTAHLQVYISSIKGHVPDSMVECVTAFMKVCYLVRQDEILTMDLEMIDKEIIHFHCLQQVFIDTGVHVSVSLPQQHVLVHYLESIVLFGCQTDFAHLSLKRNTSRL